MRYLMSAIDRIMAMGGSYLLNVGPDANGTITEEYADRIRKIGNWYHRMEGCLENAEEDTFDYQAKNEAALIAVKKNGKSYLHFYKGLSSTAVSFRAWPAMPKTVRLMNTGALLPFYVECLPEYAENHITGEADIPYLHVRNIPIDDLAQEPIVLEMTW